MTIAVLQKADNESVASILRDSEKSLNRAQDEVLIDFSSIARLDASSLRSLVEFASKAKQASIKVKLRGVNVDVYKVLLLMKLTSQFSFVN
jgi:anti-anti-sigma regulatory factor